MIRSLRSFYGVGFIGLLMTTLRSHPAMPVLMMREVMLPGGVMRERALARPGLSRAR